MDLSINCVWHSLEIHRLLRWLRAGLYHVDYHDCDLVDAVLLNCPLVGIATDDKELLPVNYDLSNYFPRLLIETNFEFAINVDFDENLFVEFSSSIL